MADDQNQSLGAWLDPFGDVYAAQQQAAAQQDALNQTLSAQRDAQQQFQDQSAAGIAGINFANQYGQSQLLNSYFDQQDALRAGQEGAAGALHQGVVGQLEALNPAYYQARGELGAGYDQAAGQLHGLTGLQGYGASAASSISAYDALGHRQDRVGAMLDQPGGLYGGFEQDPGYQFRQQQGEQAIMRQAAAGGGRESGATMKALADYNQGLASQEFGNYAARQQAAAGLAAGSDAQYSSLLQGQAGRADAAALAAQGNQMGLANLGYGAQSGLANLYNQRGQSLSGMTIGQGQQIAGLSDQYSQNLADLYNNYASQNASAAQQYGQSSSSSYANAAANMANIGIGVGANAQQNAAAQGSAYQNYAQYGGMAAQAGANNTKELAAMIAAFARYERLGLRGVRWTWNKVANGLGLRGVSEGVIAQEVMRKYPEAVGVRGNWFVVDYGLLDRLLAGAA